MMLKLIRNAALITAVLSTGPLLAETITLNASNTVTIRGEVTGSSMTNAQMEIFQQVNRRGSQNYPIYLVLDSPGGSIAAGNMFIQFAKTIRNLHTISIFSASMASAIVEQLPGDRLVTQNGTLMFHQAYAGVEGTVETGSLEARLWYIKRQVLQLETANATRMSMNLADYKGLVVRELWLDSGDSITYRAADRQVDIVCSTELIKQTSELTVASFFGSFNIKFSACPLFRVPISVSDNRIRYLFGAESVAAKTSFQLVKNKQP